jgi:mRNA-degrading endonuclease toxin of MazEF toxin-antitoxin module
VKALESELEVYFKRSNMNTKPYYKKSEIVWIEFGDLLKDVEFDDCLNKTDISKRYGIKMNREFAYKHMGLIVTPAYLNEETLLVIPITTKNLNYEKKLERGYKNIYLLTKQENPFLANDSVLLLDKILHIDKVRVKTHMGFVRKRIFKDIIRSLQEFLTL